MTPTMAISYCAHITAREWAPLDNDQTLDLWTVFRSYVLNGYDDAHIGVPARISAVWGRCKAIIDKAIIDQEGITPPQR